MVNTRGLFFVQIMKNEAVINTHLCSSNRTKREVGLHGNSIGKTEH